MTEKRYELHIKKVTEHVISNVVKRINETLKYTWFGGDRKLSTNDVEFTERMGSELFLTFDTECKKVTWFWESLEKTPYENKYSYTPVDLNVMINDIMKNTEENTMTKKRYELKIVTLTEGIIKHLVRTINEETEYKWASGQKLCEKDTILTSYISQSLCLHFNPQDSTITFSSKTLDKAFCRNYDMEYFVYAGGLQTARVENDYQTLLYKLKPQEDEEMQTEQKQYELYDGIKVVKITDEKHMPAGHVRTLTQRKKGSDVWQSKEGGTYTTEYLLEHYRPLDEQHEEQETEIDTYKLQEQLESLLDLVQEVNYHKNELESNTLELKNELEKLNINVRFEEEEQNA